MRDDGTAVHLTVGQVAARLGTTVRALHHWDDVGLAAPSSRSASGYRLYTPEDVDRLRRVMVYRELGLGLDDIRCVLDDLTTPVVDALRARQEQLALRTQQLQELADRLERMADAHEHGLGMSQAEQSSVFGPHWNPDWPGDARQRYGDTLQWRQYAERAASRTPDQWSAVVDAAGTLEQALAAASDAGVEPGSAEANGLAERHRATFAAYFPITREMQVLLCRMFEADPAYAAHYDGIRPGLASWLRRAVDADARAHGVDPDTAVWPDVRDADA